MSSRFIKINPKLFYLHNDGSILLFRSRSQVTEMHSNFLMASQFYFTLSFSDLISPIISRNFEIHNFQAARGTIDWNFFPSRQQRRRRRWAWAEAVSSSRKSKRVRHQQTNDIRIHDAHHFYHFFYDVSKSYQNKGNLNHQISKRMLKISRIQSGIWWKSLIFHFLASTLCCQQMN